MAIFHFNIAVISAAKGSSAVRAAAYRHGAQMTSDALGETWSYEGKAKEVVYSKVTVPEDLPEWAENKFGSAAFEKALREVRSEAQIKKHDMSDDLISREAWARVSAQLWNSVEDGENRLNIHAHKARYARSLTISLPAELELQQQIALMDGFIDASFTGRGMVADWEIHDKLDGNPHAHVMLTTREIGTGDWGKKQRAWNDKSLLSGWRSDWARHTNLALERAGFDVRIDHRSNAARGIYLEPEGCNPHVAEHGKSRGDVAREDLRCQGVQQRNAGFLRDNPEHILVVVQAQRAVFTAGDVLKALQERMVFGEDQELDALLREVMGSEHLVEIFQKTPDGHRQYITTARAADIQRLGARSRDMAGGRLALADQEMPVAELISPTLNPDQRAAAKAMLSSAPLTLIKGHAGTGKTYTLNEVARVWQERGYEVLGGAPSGKATQELNGIAGMRTGSLAAWEARWARGETLPKDQFVFIMDEAGMVGAGQWARIADHVAAMGGKMIVVGDPEQLQPISDVPGWDVVERAVASENGSMAVMGAVQRQRDPVDCAATEALARGGAEIGTAIRHYVNKGALRVDRDVLDDPISALAEAYYQIGADRDRTGVSPSRIALAYTNRDVWDLNAAIRLQALERGEVDGSRVRNYGNITRIDRSGEIHQRIEVPLELGPGDRVMLTRPHRELDLPRSSFGTVVATRDGEIDLLVDGGSKPVTLDLKTFRDLDYGYAATIHKSQGLTVDYALVLGHWRLNRHAIYVALTRHCLGVMVFGHPKHLTRPADLIRMAQTPGHLSVDLEDGPDQPVGSMVAGAEVLGLGARGDWLGSGVSGDRGQVSFLGDANLMAVAERVSGLLASEYIQGDPILKDDPNGPSGGPDLNAGSDPNGYAQTPTRVIDDLIARRSVFKADDVASALSQVVAEPETFLRLFREAMAHPDLVVLSEDGNDSEGRIYSTRVQLRTELDAVDMGTRLALEKLPEMAPVVEMRAEDEIGLNAEQMAALEHGAQSGRLRLIRGDAGSGKTRVAARLAEVHARDGWQVIGVTPSGAGLDALWDAGFRDGRTLRQFTRDRSEGRLQLDPGTVVILDDAGRFGGREAGQMLKDIEASGAKLIALMDNGVQVPLEAGPVMRAIEVRVESARLETMQGRAAEMGHTLRAIAAGDAHGTQMLMDQGVLHAGGTVQGSAAALATRYLIDQSEDKIMLAWSRSEVALLTKAIRAGLDAVDEARAGFVPETDGAFAGLKPGDHIRFVASTPWQKGKPAKDAPPRIRAGARAELMRRDEEGRLHLRLKGRLGVREVIFAPDAEIPEWRFDFASTIHGEMGGAHGSVHMLASPGMNRQVMAAGMNLHLDSLSVTMPCAENRLPEVMAGILRRDARAQSVLDYGFDTSLGAREALRGQVFETAPEGTALAVERLREIARLDPRPAHKALPRGMEGEVLAEVIGAMILHEGAAPEGVERLAVERVVADISDPRAWRKLLRQVPNSLPRAADDLARSTASADGKGRLLTPARIMARGALMGQALGEDRVATLFERGLVLYGKRVEAARLLGQPEDLVPPQRARVPEKEWPDPAARPEKWKPFQRGQHSQAKARVTLPWRIDVARLLGEVPRAEQVIAEQVLEDMAGMFGLGRRRRSKGYLKRYSAWRVAAKTRAVDVARGAGALDQTPSPEKTASKVLDRSQQQRSRDITAEAAQKVALVKTRSGPWDRAPIDPMAVPGRDYAGMGLQLAQVISERVDVHSTVQDMDLPASLEAMVRAADPGPKFSFTDEDIMARIPKLPRLEGESVALAAALGKALSEGPPDDIATLRGERAVILSYLVAPEALQFAAKEFVPRLRSFTHNELWAMSTPSAEWPSSLPPRSTEERHEIAQSFNGYADKFEKEKTMQNAEQTKGIKDEMVKKMALGRVDTQSMEVIEKVFSLDEIMALMDPKLPLPDGLPSLTQAARDNIANTLQRVSRGEIAGAGGSGQAPIPAPQMKIAPEHATLGLQMACAITDRVDASSPVHKLPLQAQISQLLKQAVARSDIPQEQVKELAGKIAKDRAALESKIVFAKELIADAPPPTLQGMQPDRFNEYLFLNQVRLNGGYDRNEHPMRSNQYLLRERFTHEIEGRIAKDIAAGRAEPTKEEYLVARMALLPDRSKAEVKVSDALTDALKWGRPIEAQKLREERIKLPVELASVGDIGSLKAEDTLARVYRSFTYPEIMALADPERSLPKTMKAMDDVLRNSVAKGYAKSTNVSQDTLLKFPWKNHAMRHGLGIAPGQSLSRGSGMSMS